MSKAILKFDLSDPDDLIDFKRTTKANDMAFTLFEIFRNTKKGLEWDISTKISDAKDKGEEFSAFDALDLIYDTLFEKLNDNDINIDDLV
jgi:hypothetical protein